MVVMFPRAPQALSHTFALFMCMYMAFTAVSIAPICPAVILFSSKKEFKN